MDPATLYLFPWGGFITLLQPFRGWGRQSQRLLSTDSMHPHSLLTCEQGYGICLSGADFLRPRAGRTLGLQFAQRTCITFKPATSYDMKLQAHPDQRIALS